MERSGKVQAEIFDKFTDVSEELKCEPHTDSPAASAASPRLDTDRLLAATDEEAKAEVRQVLASRFHGALEPQRYIKHEKSYHRFVASLACEGYTYKEMADMAGVTTATIGNLMKQPFMQELVTQQLAQFSDRAMLELRGEALGAARRLIELSKDTDINPEIYRKANNDVLDRVYGKPNQPYTHRQIDPSKMSDEELMAEWEKGRTN